MVASSFTCQPGIPVLHSKDLVNWTIINYVYTTLPFDRYKQPQHGQGSWAPSIRYHNGKYYVYFCTPSEGLLMAETTNPTKKWDLHVVKNIANWEDPCPFWDEDGQAYLLHGKKGAGPAILHKMSADGRSLLDTGVLIYQNKQKQPTLEGFKFMDKRDGYYYFAAPAGGVSTGWQSVFRSKNIYGPYEDKIVLAQGKTEVNGPHQGGLVQTQTGEWWFIHFQDKGAYGRITHLQPAVCKNGWPIIGADPDGDGIGEPVLTYRKPNVGRTYPRAVPQTSDEFTQNSLGLQWQWQAEQNEAWYSLTAHSGQMRLYATPVATDTGSLVYAGNLLMQKFMAPTFQATTQMSAHLTTNGERAGLVVFGNDYTCICLQKEQGALYLTIDEAKRVNKIYQPHKQLTRIPVSTQTLWFSVRVNADATYRYTYSTDGKNYKSLGDQYKADKGFWVGAKVGVFCLNPTAQKTAGYADFDYVRVEK
ncbi:glycoside hydrolase family 43 protein [Mucilaginibacter robiniae]|uniref:glycoside hydrolase family 43 protein n=1 Tax=Mucilaginibacter robiniae TaxID=2728022 RepID=UPI001B7CDF12|nr:glycoside hydrolase 43 family protein [Mucilaginibacter robiniae]